MTHTLGYAEIEIDKTIYLKTVFAPTDDAKTRYLVDVDIKWADGRKKISSTSS